MTQKPALRLAVLISGSGRTLKNFIDLASAGELPVDIKLVISSSAKAGGLDHATDANISTQVCCREDLPSGNDGHQAYSESIFFACRKAEVDYVVMAGFIKYLPIPSDFEMRVLNIHPSLIPNFCGKGMYGHHVHEAVIAAGAKKTGCTVHFVDNEYDHGPIIWQQEVTVRSDDTADTLAARVFEAESIGYPQVLRMLASGRIHVEGQAVRIANE